MERAGRRRSSLLCMDAISGRRDEANTRGRAGYVGYQGLILRLVGNALRQIALLARLMAAFLVGFAALAFLTLAQEGADLRGTVADSTGLAIEGAQIEYRSPDGVILAKTDASGNFSFAETRKGGSLRISFPGFATVTLEVRPHTSVQRVRIVLTPSPNIERLQVKATIEDPIPAVPMSQYAIPAEQLEVAGSLVVDDVLRQVPGFSTFRRSSSLFANPSSQGVSLRGVGASATSRSSVLLDGIPLNDPFGGWVYFARVPRAELETHGSDERRRLRCVWERSAGRRGEPAHTFGRGSVCVGRSIVREHEHAGCVLCRGSASRQLVGGGIRPDVAHGRLHFGAAGPTRKRGYGCGDGGPGGDAGGFAQSGGAGAVFRARKRLWRKPAEWNAAAEKRHDDPGSGFGTGPDDGARGDFFGAALWFNGDLSPDRFPRWRRTATRRR